MGIEFDLILRYGTERGRYFLLGVVWVPIIALTAAEKPSGVQPSSTGGRAAWTLARDRLGRHSSSAVCAVCGAVYVLCCRSGQNLSEKRNSEQAGGSRPDNLALSAYDKAKERENGDFSDRAAACLSAGPPAVLTMDAMAAVQCAAAAAARCRPHGCSRPYGPCFIC